MSFLPLDQQENQPAGVAPVSGGRPVSERPPDIAASGGSAGAATGGGPTKASAGGTPTQFGSSASKLGDYLNANAPQVGQQAQSVANKFNDQFGQLQQGIQGAANQFGQQVQGGYAASNPNAVKQAVTNPTQFAMNPESVKAFQGQYNDQYTGPQNFTGTKGYGDIQGQVQAAQQQANLLGTQAGLQSYLQGRGNNPTPASSTLDALLLRGNPGAQKQIQDAASQFGGLTGQLGSVTQSANQSVADAQKAAADAQAYARGQFDPVIANWQTGLNNIVAGNEAQRTKYNANEADILSKLNSGGIGLTADQIAQLGPSASYPQIAAFNKLGTINSQQYGGAGNVNLANYLQGNLNPYNNVATIANSASPEDYAKAQAFAQLAGTGFNNPLPGTASSPWTLPTSYGATLNTGGALEAQGGALKAADQQIIATHGNPYLDANGNPVGISASDPMDVQRIMSALQRLNNPNAYTGVDETITPNQPPISMGGGVIDPTTGKPPYSNPPVPDPTGRRVYK